MTPSPSDDRFVDLGLPSGILWAKMNLGAESISDYGQYYQWGATGGYKQGAGYNFSENTYNATPAAQISTDLNPNDGNDAAFIELGENCCMPSIDNFNELIENTVSGWTSDYNGSGVAGYIFYKKVDGKTSFSAYSLSDTHIFMPAAGCYVGSALYNAGSYGFYWSSTYRGSDSACSLYFGSGNCYTDVFSRYYGRSVRAIKKT